MAANLSGLFPDIGVGLVGGGFMSQVRARAARTAGAPLLGVASRTADGAARAQSALGVAQAYASFDEM
jgi:predicted dehydrogenase